MRKIKIILNSFILLSFFVPCLLLAKFTIGTQTYPSEQQSVLEGINTYRMKHGLKPLVLNSYISEEARVHSLEMAEDKIPFGHQGFNYRMEKMFKHFEGSDAFAENVAFTSEEIMTVIPMWIESRGHRENIEGDYNLTGIGIAYDKSGRVYVTQIFLKDEAKLG